MIQMIKNFIIIIIIIIIFFLLLVQKITAQEVEEKQQVVVDFKKLMPSVMHLTHQDFKETTIHHYQKSYTRSLFQAHKPSMMLFHTPNHQHFANGELYKEFQQLAERVGAFVGLAAVNVEEIPFKFAQSKFEVLAVPAIRYWNQGRHKKMQHFKLPRNVNNPQNKLVVYVDELEDFIFDELISNAKTLEYDYLNLDDDDDEELEECGLSTTMMIQEPAVDELLEARTNCLRKKQDEEINNAILTQTSKKSVFLLTITIPSRTKHHQQQQEQDDNNNNMIIPLIVERQIRRLEAMIHTLQIHLFSINNVRWAIVKQPSAATKDDKKIRVKLELLSLDLVGAEPRKSEVLVYDVLSVADALAMPNKALISLSYTELNKLMVKYSKPKIPKEHQQFLDNPNLKTPIVIQKDRTFWNKVTQLWNDTTPTSSSQQQQQPSINIRYRKVFEDCKSIKECYEITTQQHEPKRFVPFIIRHPPEFISQIPNAEELLKIFRGESMIGFEVDGLLPNLDWRTETVADLASKWTKTGTDFESNVFQAHVNRTTFPYKMPAVFDEITPESPIDPRTNAKPTRRFRNSMSESEFAKLPRRPLHASLTPQFSNMGAYSPLHSDPGAYGNVWMYLASGTKHWELMHHRHYSVSDPVQQALGEMNLDYPERFFNLSAPDEIDVEDNNKYYFDIYCGTINAGDLIILPIGWIHRVWTGDTENTIGVAGYNFANYNTTPSTDGTWIEYAEDALQGQDDKYQTVGHRLQVLEQHFMWY
jgi:hypothetical protein